MKSHHWWLAGSIVALSVFFVCALLLMPAWVLWVVFGVIVVCIVQAQRKFWTWYGQQQRRAKR